VTAETARVGRHAGWRFARRWSWLIAFDAVAGTIIAVWILQWQTTDPLVTGGAMAHVRATADLTRAVFLGAGGWTLSVVPFLVASAVMAPVLAWLATRVSEQRGHLWKGALAGVCCGVAACPVAAFMLGWLAAYSSPTAAPDGSSRHLVAFAAATIMGMTAGLLAPITHALGILVGGSLLGLANVSATRALSPPSRI
jgi:hypothetical protein